MEAIKADCLDNARNMLETQAAPLGEFGTLQGFYLDGKVWIIADNAILRSDDSEESAALRKAFQAWQGILTFYAQMLPIDLTASAS